jgi:two-component system, chemotaxis family, protein-glutamate methylesterase/glutaminase
MDIRTDTMDGVPVVVLGASAGGLAALSEVLAGLSADLPAAVLVIMHLAPERPSVLSAILARRTALEVGEGHDGELLTAGHVYVATPDQHMLLTSARRIGHTSDARVSHVRPSMDVLLESVASAAGRQSLAVILTGTGSDGAAGAVAIARVGGEVIVEQGAQFDSMPRAAREAVSTAIPTPLALIAAAVTVWARGRTA